MFRMRADGMSYYKIVQELNRRGIPAPSRYHYLKGDTKCARYADVVWQPQVARRILCNEVYLGHMVQGRWRRSFYEEKQRHTVPEQEWVVVRNTHEPLVDENTFRIVQDMAAKQKAGYLQGLGKHDELGKKPNILRKLIFCAECGKAMAYKRSVYDSGKKKICYYSYICPSHENDTESCRVTGVRADTLMDTLQGLLQKQAGLAVEISVKAAAVRVSGCWETENKVLEKEYGNAWKELERLRMLYDSLYPMYADEKVLTEQEYMRMKQDYRMRIEQAEKALGCLEEKKRARAAQLDGNPWLEACTAYRDETEITEEMAHALISRIEIHADKRISVSLRWQDEFQNLVQALETEGGAYHDKC